MLKIKGRYFIDENNRVIKLQGVNLGGSSKLPYGSSTHDKNSFFEHKAITFVGRPFPLEEADEHFNRLKAWGFNFLRFLITWEAIEHYGPGEYDSEYIDYVVAVIEKAAEYDFMIFIDPHQDIWGRYSGGDGAPGWTYDAAGFDIRNLQDTGAAIIQNLYEGSFPKMIWTTNYNKLAAATMFTLFFGGKDFAPKCIVDGVSIQDYLQKHYIDAVMHLAARLSHCRNVVGFDTFNEPVSGYIEKSLRSFDMLVKLGPTPTPLQSFALGDGVPQEVELIDLTILGYRKRGTQWINKKMLRAWKRGEECIWKKHGVWDYDNDGSPVLLKEDYFLMLNNKKVDFAEDYMKPFMLKYRNALQDIRKDWILFYENNLDGNPIHIRDMNIDNLAYAPHWYDEITHFIKNFYPFYTIDVKRKKFVLGPKNVGKTFERQLSDIKEKCWEYIGDVPVIIGEVGIPYDMDNKKAFITGSFSKQIKAMDTSMRALEKNLLNYTIWCYAADNNNTWGDHWNDEDFSIYSRDQVSGAEDIYSGGRALEAVIRPYSRKTAGIPVSSSFDIKAKTFRFSFRLDSEINVPTEIFVPDYHYPNGCRVDAPNGSFRLNKKEQLLLYYGDPTSEIHEIIIKPK
ncbi:MAG: cellulase family glycosylhydrolase [Bacillota bacterium]